MKWSRQTCVRLAGWLCCCVSLLGASSLVQAQTTAVGAITAVGTASPPVRYSGAAMSLQLSDVEVREALAQVAQFTGLNLVVSDSVSGKLTLRVHQVPWDQVLDLIAQARGLHVRRQGRVVWIATRAEVAARDKAQLEEWQATQNLEPVQTRHFVLHYARALDVQMRLQGGGASAATTVASPHAARVLSARGAVVADPRTNQLFVTDVPERLNQVAHIVSHMDVPLRQVMIEARIVQANDSFGQSLGVRLGQAARAGVPLTGSKPVGVDGLWVNLPASSVAGAEATSFAVSIFQPGQNRLLNLELSALEADGKGKVVSSPRVVTADQTKAVIEQGTELPYQTAAGTGMTTIAFRKANLRLEVVPQITPEGSIVLDLDIHKDSVGQSTPAGFAIDNRHVNTQVRVDDGGTVMIGGIYETAEQEDIYKVPLLGDLPGVGALFRNHKQTQVKQELLVFITPKMLLHRASAP